MAEGLGPHPTLPRPQKAQIGEGVSGSFPCDSGEVQVGVERRGLGPSDRMRSTPILSFPLPRGKGRHLFQICLDSLFPGHRQGLLTMTTLELKLSLPDPAPKKHGRPDCRCPKRSNRCCGKTLRPQHVEELRQALYIPR